MAFSRRVRFALPRIFRGVLLEQLPNVISRSGKVIKPLRLTKGAVTDCGCVVLDQPQRLGTNRDAKPGCLLWPFIDTAAIRVA